jgi:hypothetical protein
MTLEDSVHTQRLRVLRAAEHLGNVGEACRRRGLSQTLFYRLRKRFEQYGSDGVHPKRHRPARGRPSPIPVQTERRVMAMALAWPTCGPQWYSDQLAREGVMLASTTIWRLLRRHRLGTRRARLAVLERASAAEGLLTEGTIRPLRHVAASATRATCSRWTPSMWASSRGSARSGRSPVVMGPRPTGSRSWSSARSQRVPCWPSSRPSCGRGIERLVGP